uniref:Grancalcin n=1 Tax=Bos mutus grunniens TaxID=30521 RepID=A0A8B9XVI8_BOSMU
MEKVTWREYRKLQRCEENVYKLTVLHKAFMGHLDIHGSYYHFLLHIKEDSTKFGNFGNPLGQPGYPGHPAYPGSISTGDPMWKCFLAIAGQDGEVDAEELQKCLTQSGISGTYSPFSLETCRIMIAMLDRDYSGKMGFNEFKELWAALNSWKQNFITVDKDGSGSVEHHELNQAIAAMGYRLSPQTVTTIVKRYSKNGRIFFDDYVACCVKLRALTGMDHLWAQYYGTFFPK